MLSRRLLSLSLCSIALAAADLEVAFDQDWRFVRQDVAGASAPAFDDAAWRTLRLPHDWSIEALPATAGSTAIETITGTWRMNLGDDAGWAAPGFDDQAWKTVGLPAGLKKLLGKAPENAFCWFRRTLPARPVSGPVTLLLGAIDDVDETFLNGVRIGGMGTFPPAFTNAWDTQRAYAVPAGLYKGDGTDVVAVRCYNGESDGGIHQAGILPQRVGPFDTLASQGQGYTAYTVGGTGWYRRHFDLTPDLVGRHVELRFGGIYRNAKVWCNGQPVGERPYGYSEFTCDLTPHLKATGNVIAVQVANEGRNSRWYSGSGIYRHATLLVSDHLRVVPNGLAVTTADSGATTTVTVTTEVTAREAQSQAVVAVTLRGPTGAVVGRGSATVAVPAQGTTTATVAIAVTGAVRWSLANPALHTAEVTIAPRADAPVADRDRTTFGIRTVRVSAEQGLTIDGVPVKLRGGCVHHDNGLLGAVANDRADERRLELLKARGYNAVRASHNPPSRAYLAACDRLGILVLDEAFDMWNEGKNPEDYHRDFAAWSERDLTDMVRRDRNHPSIVLWSIGNEIPEQYKPEGLATATRLAGLVRGFDPTRPVTQALNGFDKQGHPQACAVLDVAGYNYRNSFAADLKEHPGRIMVSTESFPLHACDAWYAAADCPAALGDFVWTAFDYLGEAGCGFLSTSNEFYRVQPFPTFTGNTGDLDICGFQRPQSLFRDVLWGVRSAAIVVQSPRPEGAATKPNPWGWPDVIASWNWPGQLHQPMSVVVYANGDEVELFQDGQSLGRRPATRAERHTARFTVPWRAGTLTAKVYTAGQESGSATLASTGLPSAVRLTADRATVRGDGDDLSYVTVEVVDAAGHVVPDAQVPVALAVSGHGVLEAAGNGAANDAASFRSTTPRTHEGRCLAIVRPAGVGQTVLTATVPGLPEARLTITAAK